MGRVCASEEELPVRNLIRTFRFDVLSPEIRDDKVLPRMIACDSSFVANTLMNAVIWPFLTVGPMKRRWMGEGAGEIYRKSGG